MAPSPKPHICPSKVSAGFGGMNLPTQARPSLQLQPSLPDLLVPLQLLHLAKHGPPQGICTCCCLLCNALTTAASLCDLAPGRLSLDPPLGQTPRGFLSQPSPWASPIAAAACYAIIGSKPSAPQVTSRGETQPSAVPGTLGDLWAQCAVTQWESVQ